MKYWLNHLPLEVWVDCYRYPWISRRELGQIVDRFRNRRYTEYLQFYLHDWGKHKLGNLTFAKNGISKLVHIDYDLYSAVLGLGIPQTPMPGNITSFESISISHFDAQTIAFLRHIGPLLTNVNLNFCGISPKNLNNFRLVFTNLQPLLRGIHSFSFDVCALATMAQLFRAEFSKIKVLEIYHESLKELDEATVQAAMVDSLLNWLISKDDIGPRLCKIDSPRGLYEQIFSAIRQQFLSAKTPSTFALVVCRTGRWVFHRFAEFRLQNNIGEELHCVEKPGLPSIFQITRNRCGTELQEWIEANAKTGCRQIRISYPTIGSLDGMDSPEDADLQPSTSKKARIPWDWNLF